MIEHEAMLAQNIGFLGVAGPSEVDGFEAIGVAGGVKGSGSFEFISGRLVGDVSIKAGSLGGGGVTGVVDIAVSFGGVSAGSSGVAFASSFGVAFASLFGEGIVISLAGFSGFFWW